MAVYTPTEEEIRAKENAQVDVETTRFMQGAGDTGALATDIPPAGDTGATGATTSASGAHNTVAGAEQTPGQSALEDYGAYDIRTRATDPQQHLQGYGSSTVDSQKPEDPAATAAGYVREESTVAGQMDKLLSEDSKYMGQAEARGRAQAQAHGWSGSMAGESAVEASRINAAMQIAKPDAATHADRDKTEHMYDVSERMASLQHDLDTIGKGLDTELKKNLVAYTHDTNVKLQKMGLDSREMQTAMGLVGATSNVLLQNMANINQNTDLPQADKDAAIGQLIEEYKQLTNLYTRFISKEIIY